MINHRKVPHNNHNHRYLTRLMYIVLNTPARPHRVSQSMAICLGLNIVVAIIPILLHPHHPPFPPPFAVLLALRALAKENDCGKEGA